MPRAVANGEARQPMLAEVQGCTARANGGENGENNRPNDRERPALVGVCALYRDTTHTERLMLSIAIVGAAIQGASGPAMSLFMKGLFESIFLPNDNGSRPPHGTGSHHARDDQVLHSFFIFLGLAAVSFVAGGCAYVGFSRVADRVSFRLKLRFFDQLLQRDVAWYDCHDSAEMATRLTNDTYDFRQGTGEKFGQVIIGMVMSPAGIAVAFTHDWRLTLILMLVLPLMMGTMGVAMKKMSNSAKAQQEFYAKAGGVAEVSLSSIRTVAAFGGYDREIDKYGQQLLEAQKSGTRAGWMNGFALGATQGTMYCVFALGFYIGSLLVIHDYNSGCWEVSPPFGTCFTGATMLSTLFAFLYGGIGLAQVAPGLAVVATARAAAARIYAVIDEPPAFDADAGLKPQVIEGSVHFQDVTFFYPTRCESPVLSNVTFKVPAGKTAAFVGPSGSGKSTIIALLQRFYTSSSGKVMVDGHDIKDWSANWLRTRMALVQQEPVLFSGSIHDNISYGKHSTSSAEEVEAAAMSANAHMFISGFPSKYQTEVGERGVQMSGGQKQRIAIARALIRNPAILLLDEATSALDSESERIVQQALDELVSSKSRTTLIIAHRLSTIQNADEIFFLESGHILESGSHKSLMATPGSAYRQHVQLQALTAAEGQIQQGEQSQTTQSSAGLCSSGSHSSALNLDNQHTLETSPDGQRSSRANAEVSEDKTSEMQGKDDEPTFVPMTRLWALQKPDLSLVILALICTSIAGALRPLMGFLFSDTSNLYSQPPAVFDLGTLKWRGALDVPELKSNANMQCLEFGILGVIAFLTNLGQIGGFRHTAESLTRQIRYLTFKAMLRQDISWFDARTSGALADRLASDAPLIKSFTGESLAAVIQLVVTLAVGLGIALWSSWKLTLFSLIFLPLMTAGSATLMRSMRQANETSAGPMVSQAMGNIKTVAAFGLQRILLEKYRTLVHEEHHEARKVSLATGIAAAYNGSITFLMFGGIIYVANWFLSEGWIQPDAVLQVLFPILFSASGAAMASQWQADKKKATPALYRIFHTIDSTPAIDPYSESGICLDNVQGELDFRHVAFSYPTRPDQVVFTDFNLNISKGTTVAFCGPSGSGKSTTISLLQRFYVPSEGSICLDGHDISTLNLGWLRKQMALVQQEPVLFSGSIYDNIAYGREGASLDDCVAAAKSSNAHNFIVGFPDAYQTEVGERGAKLSGGQKQRIAIARSMVRDPAILLLDEATSALDSESEQIVQKALDDLLAVSKRTTLVIAHRLSTIINSDLICVIYQGKIVEKGTHTELINMKDGQYKQLASRQQEA